jgi:hypothetical protein
MNTPNTIIEYKDDLIFSACEFRWSKGDKFALIEAIAICAANDLQYPRWVRSQIDVAMTGIFEAVFPGTPLQGGRPGLGISSLPDGAELADLKDRFQASVKEASKLLSLKLERRNIIDTHIKAVRDFHLAELVATLAIFKVDPTPRFRNVTEVKRELSTALRHSSVEWSAIESGDSDLSQVCGRKLHAHEIPAVCRMATVDIIDDAWDAYKEFFLADRIAKFEDNHGTSLGE